MNLNIFNTIKGIVLNVLSNYEQKINPLNQEPKTEVSVLMERFENQTKTNNSTTTEN